jgi:hypothetical protein
MIEIFRTNIDGRYNADRMLWRLHKLFPQYRVNFDLDDCDRILRVQSPGAIEVEPIMSLFSQAGFACSVLED